VISREFCRAASTAIGRDEVHAGLRHERHSETDNRPAFVCNFGEAGNGGS
jgi:hypothetical protein